MASSHVGHKAPKGPFHSMVGLLPEHLSQSACTALSEKAEKVIPEVIRKRHGFIPSVFDYLFRFKIIKRQ